MTIMIKRTLFVLIGPVLMTSLTTLSMEKNYPQLQLENQKNELPTIHGKLYLRDQLNTAFLLSIDDNILTKEDLLKFLGIPFMQAVIIDNSTQKKYDLSIPVNLLYNCDDGSNITFTTKHYEMFTTKTYTMCVTCMKNPKLFGKNFNEQYTNFMKKFYTKPTFSLNEGDEEKFINAGIITKTPRELFIRPACYHHGQNGCPDEKHFVKKMVSQHTKPYNNSMFQLTIGHQYGNKNHCRKLQPTTPEETQALFKRYKQLEAVEQQAEHKLMLTDK